MLKFNNNKKVCRRVRQSLLDYCKNEDLNFLASLRNSKVHFIKKLVTKLNTQSTFIECER